MGFVQKIEQITEANWYKLMMPKLYGWGAAIVILGALFKIEHLPGASYMLMAGLGMEAIIFFFSAFEKPHVDPDWSLVYPELAHMEDPNSNKRPAQQLDGATRLQETRHRTEPHEPRDIPVLSARRRSRGAARSVALARFCDAGAHAARKRCATRHRLECRLRCHLGE